MPTSVPGSEGRGPRRGRPSHGLRPGATSRGFTLIELLIVIAIVAISVSVVSLSLRDSGAAKLEEEGARLAALFEMARAESRASGAPVRWVLSPVAAASDEGPQFRFVGLRASEPFPQRWLDVATQAEIVGATGVVLGPEAIVPAQRVLLRLGDRRLELSTDGLAPFAVQNAAAAAAAP
jgi:general secretion pathway protein H